jgi:hypothetical protein
VVAAVEDVAVENDALFSRKADLQGEAETEKGKDEGDCCKQDDCAADCGTCECKDCDEECGTTTAWVLATPLLIVTVPVAILFKEMINKTYALDQYLRNHLTWPEEELLTSVTGSMGIGELNEERVLSIDPVEEFSRDASEVTDETPIVIKNISGHRIQLRASSDKGDVSDRANEKQTVLPDTTVRYYLNFDFGFQKMEDGENQNITFHAYNPSGNQIEKKVFVLKRN